MSELLLRNLLLSSTSAAETSYSGLTKSISQTLENIESTATSALNKIDSLLLSSNSTNKGSIPVELAPPKNLQVSAGKTGSSDLLQSLLYGPTTEGTKSGATSAARNSTPTLKPLPGLQYTSTTNIKASYTETQTNGKKIVSNYTSISNFSFIETQSDPTLEKFDEAIEKIENWNRKVTTLNHLLQEQKVNGNKDGNALISSSKQLTKAKEEAVEARSDAIRSYGEAVRALQSSLTDSGMASFATSKYSSYEASYKEMEDLFQVTQQKDKGIMDKVVDYLAGMYNTTKAYIMSLF